MSRITMNCLVMMCCYNLFMFLETKPKKWMGECAVSEEKKREGERRKRKREREREKERERKREREREKERKRER